MQSRRGFALFLCIALLTVGQGMAASDTYSSGSSSDFANLIDTLLGSTELNNIFSLILTFILQILGIPLY
ncbi:MAG TPA: hypothetical protein VN372_13090 [Methanospirillum sp.]|nr:hypothetical protein [Methanospirillum sp.]